MTQAAQLFHGVDRALFISAFVDKLRGAGLAVSIGSSERVAQSLEVAGPVGVQELYWLLKVGLTRRRDDFEVFDAVFSAVFDFELNRTVKQAPRRNTQAVPVPVQEDDKLMHLPSPDRGGESEDVTVPWATRPSLQDSADDGEPDDDAQIIPELLPSALEHLADTPFDLLDEDELQRISEELELASHRWPMRRSRISAAYTSSVTTRVSPCSARWSRPLPQIGA